MSYSRHPEVGLEKFTGLFGKTRQGYYYRMRASTQREEINAEVVSRVVEERKRMPKLGGRKLYSKLKPELKKDNIKIGRDKFFEILRGSEMLVKRNRNYMRTTNSRHRFKKYPNLIKEIRIERAEQVWVSDITYLTTPKHKFYYLSLVTDAYTKKIVGYKLSQTLEAMSTLQALRMAIKLRRGTDGLIHHSDRGNQYCSYAYVETLEQNGIGISMTEKGDPYENAIAERVNGILKNELGISIVDDKFERAERMVKEAIITYNTQRPHLSCGMLTPEEAHTKGINLKKMWKSYPNRRARIINGLDKLSTS